MLRIVFGCRIVADQSLFQTFDIDGQGQVKVEELRDVILALGGDEEMRDRLTEIEVIKMLTEADQDADGNIQYDGKSYCTLLHYIFYLLSYFLVADLNFGAGALCVRFSMLYSSVYYT